jgi:tRNA dimethylallyltransferase
MQRDTIQAGPVQVPASGRDRDCGNQCYDKTRSHRPVPWKKTVTEKRTHKNTHCTAPLQGTVKGGRFAKITVPVILGPTAAGKTLTALPIAETGGWEIISCDSRQIYRGMDIGTAKPSRRELGRVRHWLVDILDPSERYSAHQFAGQAGSIIRERASSGKTQLICGGSGLYFESLRRGMSAGTGSDPAVRDALMRRAREEGSAVLHRELLEKDPESAAAIHANDVQRIVRALAVHAETGRKLSALKKKTAAPGEFDFRVAVLLPPRAVLYERINRRVDEMVRQGLWEEFLSLLERGCDELSPGLQCVGYQELFPVKRGACSFAAAVETIKRATRRYAKRQMTWFRSHNRGEIIECPDDDRDALVKTVLTAFSRQDGER